MADISKITTLDGTTYDVKDVTARQQIPWAVVDSTSTSTVFTATVPGITKLASGVCCILMNNKVTSASSCTLNINNLGAKPMYQANAAATRTTTQFAKDVTWCLIYNETRVEGGCWDLVYLYNTNTTYSTMSGLNHGYGFMLDSNLYRYQMLFQIDHDTVTPLNNNSNVTGKTKTMLTNVEFDPFGAILYYFTTTAVAAGARLSAANAQFMYSAVDLRYTFNCGSDTLVARQPLYLKVLIQSNGMCKIASADPLAQALPSTNDGCHYIFLGVTYSTYQIVLWPHHPIYYYDGTRIRQYTFPSSGGTHTFSNVQVASSAWSTTGGTTNYPYCATISLTGATANMFPHVVFSEEDAISGNFSPIAQSGSGTVTIWAYEAPESSITIPTIMLVDT